MDKNTPAISSIDEYISATPPEVQAELQTLRQVIREAAPDAKEKIAYQMPTFDLHGNLVHFAAFKKHFGFYPTSSGIAVFNDELSAYKTSKGAVQFPIGESLPYGLIRRIVEYRVRENIEKAEVKASRKRVIKSKSV
ncbi:uncharacterized protein YdhG (YjbR/CyaY superfamily) [Paenibacillus taihuensis]|uniref:Uncharacterized protein YdhG (YjbR/CyaY superfamily) n=1 Tax=Paenibacillus taihuensis TaxID=1156355 RepID=A0A3D9SSE0_9BACL|nr:DUF1801 domain-containing protein [Paenibacillus taihuensis]REE94631.1 uncharacterized protein YdhG (YjbR/CyaY superfamily) [Paenibacillus taihuensis]